MEFWLHPIIAWPAARTPETSVALAKAAGFTKLVISPLRGWNRTKLLKIPPEMAGTVEETWNTLATDNVFAKNSWLRVLGKRTAAQAAFPWDNLFWGDYKKSVQSMAAIQALFPHAIYSEHAPSNTTNWPGPYAWEINPDHGIYGEAILETPGMLCVDTVHFTRPAREDSTKRVVAPEDAPALLTKLVERRSDDIVTVHLHLSATQIVPFSLGIVPELVRTYARILAPVKNGNFPVILEYMPPAPISLTFTSAVFFLTRMRKVAEGLFAQT
jgi:hypothetical protein